ncbi:MAG: hypothetical protein GY870_20855 [archaeon]|nr:hypothetical protein [archaeon]
MNTLQQDKLHFAVLFIIILMAIPIRLLFLFQPIRYDEAYTFIMYASKPLYIGLSTYYLPNNHLFHTILVHIAFLILGNEPWILRLPALLAGVLIVPASYFSIRILYNKHAALLTAAFTASSSILIEYSTLARGYTLICLFFLLLIVLGAYLIQKDKSLVWYFFVLIATLGFFTIPIMLYPFGIVVVWLFLYSFLKDTNSDGYNINLKNLILCIIITTLFTSLLYTPVLIVSGSQSFFANRFVISRSLSYFFSHFPYSLSSTWIEWNRDIPVGISYILALGFATAVLTHKRLTQYRIPLILSVIAFVLLVLIAQRVVPYNRVWLFLLPLYIGIACTGCYFLIGCTTLINKHYTQPFYSALALVFSMYLSFNAIHTKSVYKSNDLGTLRDAEQISFFLKDYLKTGDKVLVVCPSDFPIIYYFNKLNIPIEYLITNINSADHFLNKANRILIIVNNHEQSLEDLLSNARLKNYEAAKIVKKYKEATIFQLRVRGNIT